MLEGEKSLAQQAQERAERAEKILAEGGQTSCSGCGRHAGDDKLILAGLTAATMIVERQRNEAWERERRALICEAMVRTELRHEQGRVLELMKDLGLIRAAVIRVLTSSWSFGEPRFHEDACDSGKGMTGSAIAAFSPSRTPSNGGTTMGLNGELLLVTKEGKIMHIWPLSVKLSFPADGLFPRVALEGLILNREDYVKRTGKPAPELPPPPLMLEDSDDN